MKTGHSHHKTIQNIIAVALAGVCVGRAYQCIFWDIPIRSLIWNEDVFAGIIKVLFNLEWSEYLDIAETSGVIGSLVSGIGWSLLLALCLVFFPKKIRLFSISWITLISLFIAFLYHLEKFNTAGQFFEYSLQFMTPILFYLLWRDGVNRRWLILAKVCIALTFTSHGLYAIGFYPVPGNFVAMTINILHVSNDTAILLLQIAGIIDVLVSIGIFFSGKIFNWSIWYCIIWGALTALARIAANIDIDWFFSSLHQWAYQTVYRIPHFLVPFTVWWSYKNTIPSTEKEF